MAVYNSLRDRSPTPGTTGLPPTLHEQVVGSLRMTIPGVRGGVGGEGCHS